MASWRPIPQPFPYYTGPYFNFTNLGWSAELGPYIEGRREACFSWFHGVGLHNLDPGALQAAASHTYFLTLWPAFISIIVAIGPDGGQIAYDNLLWCGIFTITSGALPGIARPKLPHHFDAHTLEQAHELCAHWQDHESDPSKSSRSGKLRAGKYVSESRILAFAVGCIALWAGFPTWYMVEVYKAEFISNEKIRIYGTIWYMAAASPALARAIFNLIFMNIELWEPIPARRELRSIAPVIASSGADGCALPANGTIPPPPTDSRSNFSAVPRFSAQKYRSAFHIWRRITYLQFTKQKYRVLVKQSEPVWLDLLMSGCCQIGQLVLFVWGCMTQGAVLFMATPSDYGLTALLLFTTAAPRLVWPYLWGRGRRGADIVVWYTPAF